MGEIVITTLVKEGAPLIRYRTHDLSRIIPGECPCGSKHPRLDTIMGRTDDMMKIKGVNVFPSQIEEVLQSFSDAASEYQIRISHLDGKDTMRMYVEAVSGSVDFKDLSDRIAVKVKSVRPPAPQRKENQARHRRALRLITKETPLKNLRVKCGGFFLGRVQSSFI